MIEKFLGTSRGSLERTGLLDMVQAQTTFFHEKKLHWLNTRFIGPFPTLRLTHIIFFRGNKL